MPLIEKKDAPVLEAAARASADYLLTLNTKDFTADVAKASGLNIQTPGSFIVSIRAILSENL